jgi:hypothetical protein
MDSVAAREACDIKPAVGDVGTTPACLSFWDISTRPYVPFLERDRQPDESQRQSTAAISMG